MITRRAIDLKQITAIVIVGALACLIAGVWIYESAQSQDYRSIGTPSRYKNQPVGAGPEANTVEMVEDCIVITDESHGYDGSKVSTYCWKPAPGGYSLDSRFITDSYLSALREHVLATSS